MTITVTENEAVIRDGERWQIGDKVYGEKRAGFGVGYITAIELHGVHFGFEAKIEGTILDEPIWVSSRCLTKEIPLSDKEIERIESDLGEKAQLAKV